MSSQEAQRLGDEELMTLVQRDDRSAFAVLYDRHGAPAYSLAYRMMGDRGAAEDVVQDAFLAVWNGSAQYDASRASVRTWLLRIVRNRAIDVLRRGAVRPQLAAPASQAAVEDQPAPGGTDVEALRRDGSRQLRGALEQIPSEQSRVIDLAYFGGFTQNEIADMLKLPLGTIKGRLRLGLEKMRAQLTEASR